MTKGLFTSSEEVKFQQRYTTPVARPQVKKKEKFKPLFTSREEIKFQYAYMHGNVEKARDPNTIRDPRKLSSVNQEAQLVGKKQNRILKNSQFFKTR